LVDGDIRAGRHSTGSAISRKAPRGLDPEFLHRPVDGAVEGYDIWNKVAEEIETAVGLDVRPHPRQFLPASPTLSRHIEPTMRTGRGQSRLY
jgi:hypothetical protein